MDHLAILSAESKLLAKILSGEKTIESRWYRYPKTPYHNIKTGETVYFKESGKPVTVKAKVNRVLFFEDLEDNIINLLTEYGARIGVPLSYADRLKDKRYCTLIFLEKVEKVSPFQIDKTGYGNMTAWITVESIEEIRKK